MFHPSTGSEPRFTQAPYIGIRFSDVELEEGKGGPVKQVLYERDGARFTPQPPSVSPWNPQHQAGVPLAALVTWLIEQAPAAEPMLLTRVTMDIIRPAPMRTLTGRCEIRRDGRRMQNLEAVLEDEGQPVVRASAVRVRLAENPAWPMTGGYPPPEEATDRPLVRRRADNSPLQSRLAYGGLLDAGPGLAWARPQMELYPGMPISPVVCAVMTADLGSGVACVLDSRDWSFANVDLVVHFARAPRGEWIAVDARTLTEGNGAGLVETTLADRDGPFGKAHQTLFIAPQPARAGSRPLAEASA